MKCYVTGTNNSDDPKQPAPGLVSFAVPDLGVQFRARHEGNRNACAYSALLVFLRFMDNNPQLFKEQRIEILTDSPTVACQVNRLAPVGAGEHKYYTLVQTHQRKTEFTVKWVPPEENAARDGVLDVAPLKTRVRINLKPDDLPGSSPGSAAEAPRG